MLRSVTAIAIALSLLWSTHAWGDEPDRGELEDDLFGGGETDESDDRKALEDDLFGGAESDSESDESDDGADAAVSGSRDDTILGGDSRTPGDRLLDRLGELDEDPLAIGGQLYQRFEYAFQESQAFEDSTLRSPALLDLYLDARPTDRLRAFIRGRLRHDFSIAESDETAAAMTAPGGALGSVGADETQADLDQLWLKFDIERVVYLTIGRQPVRWGTGRFWNPTDFLNQTTRDPLAVFDERLGTSLAMFHFPFESVAMNLYAVAMLEDADGLDEIGAALRWEWLIDLTEIAISTAVRKDEPFRLGADISTGLWLFDLRAEAAVTYDDENTRYWEGSLDIGALDFPTARTNDDEWTGQLVAGAEIMIDYNDLDSIIAGVEYFYNHDGYSDASLYPWILFNGDYRPLYTGKHYGGFYTVLLAPGSWDDTSFTFSTLANLSDLSALGRLDARVRVLTYLDLSAWTTLFFGNEGGELKPAIDIPPVFFEGLEEGLEIPPPLFQVGMGATLRI